VRPAGAPINRPQAASSRARAAATVPRQTPSSGRFPACRTLLCRSAGRVLRWRPGPLRSLRRAPIVDEQKFTVHHRKGPPRRSHPYQSRSAGRLCQTAQRHPLHPAFAGSRSREQHLRIEENEEYSANLRKRAWSGPPCRPCGHPPHFRVQPWPTVWVRSTGLRPSMSIGGHAPRLLPRLDPGLKDPFTNALLETNTIARRPDRSQHDDQPLPTVLARLRGWPRHSRGA